MATTTTTPTDLAAKLEVDPKTLRAYLRREFPREAEQKNSRWELSAKTVKAVEAHFAAKTEAAEAKAS